jgi:phosphonate transport system permease protein
MLADLIDYRRGEAKLMSRPETAVSDVKLTGKEARAILRLRLGKTPESTRVAGIIKELQAKLDAGARQHLSAAPATTSELIGVGELKIFLYATLPTVIPQLISYTLYRWENNIRAAAVLGVVGGGGLGQMLAFHMGLFQMQETSTILLSMIGLVVMVDGLSYWIRRSLDR